MLTLANELLELKNTARLIAVDDAAANIIFYCRPLHHVSISDSKNFTEHDMKGEEFL